MNQEVNEFIEAIKEPWQVEFVTNLRDTVRKAIPDVHERIQYKKPHFLKNGKYAAVISTSKAAVSFNTAKLALPEGMFDGPSERRTLKLRKGDLIDYEQLVSFVSKASEF